MNDTNDLTRLIWCTSSLRLPENASHAELAEFNEISGMAADTVAIWITDFFGLKFSLSLSLCLRDTGRHALWICSVLLYQRNRQAIHVQRNAHRSLGHVRNYVILDIASWSTAMSSCVTLVATFRMTSPGLALNDFSDAAANEATEKICSSCTVIWNVNHISFWNIA